MNDANAVSVKQKRILTKWLRHCANLEKEYPLVAGVCADYGIDELKNVSGELKNFKHAEIESGAKALISLIQKHLQSSYKEKTRQGKEELMALAMRTFEKADALDRCGRWDAKTRDLFCSAWEFLNVATSGVEVEKGVERKKRYAMWRAVEIKKALEENREPRPPPQAVQDDESLERELEKELGILSEEQQQNERNGEDDATVAATSNMVNNSKRCGVEMEGIGGKGTDGGQQRQSRNGTVLVGIRDYFSGQDVIYCEDASGYQTVKAVVCSVAPSETSGQEKYDIMTQDGRRLQVLSELLAPDVTCGEEFVLEGSGEAVVEEIYGSQWPPKYLVKTSSGFAQASDEDLRYYPIPRPSSKIEQSDDAGEESVEKETTWNDGPPAWNETPDDVGGEKKEEFVNIPHVPVEQDHVPQRPADSDGTEAVEDSDVSWHRQDPWPETGEEIASAPDASVCINAQETDEMDGPPESNRFDGEFCEYIDSYQLPQGIFVKHGEAQNANETKNNVHVKKVRATRYSTEVKDMVDAEKCIKNASSALQFNDVATAVKYLYEALDLLEIQK